MFENNLLAGVSGQGGGYNIEDSLRFNRNDSASLSRTPSVAGNRKKWTWSGWVKRGNLVNGYMFTTTNASINDAMYLYFSADKLTYWDSKQSSRGIILESNAVFRDVSGWYHIVLVVDREAVTPTDRAKLYVNGEELLYSVATYPNQNENSFVNTTQTHYISANPNFVDGYMAEVNFIDGQALTADDFGEIDATTGEWSPKKYSGTYGTNGFYLPFNGNANDDSGNGNNWTENNLASTDYMIDTPTNNFGVFNTTVTTLSEGNLKSTFSAAGIWQTAISTIGVSSGKWYAETTFDVINNLTTLGFVGISTNPNKGTISGSNYLGNDSTSWAYLSNGSKYSNNVAIVYNATFAAGDVIGMALDMDAGTVEFYKNNVSQGVAYTGLSGTMFMGLSVYQNSGFMNYGQDSSFAGLKTRQGNTDSNGIGDFYYTPPAGYLALCTDNLPEPTIVDSETQFNVVTYTGDGTASNPITGVGFQPDFVWIKRRDAVQSHILSDSVRGAGVGLASESTSAEFSMPSEFLSFDSDGFTVGYSSTITNNSGSSYVAWCWKAGGTAVTNTDGTITSQVSANVDAGFSIVEYTGSGSSGSTVGHGLNGAPDFVLMKSSSHVTNWLAYHSSTPSGYYYVNSTAGLQSASWFSSNTDTFTLNNTYGDANTSGRTYIAYCFHSVDGFSKIGKYTGNGSADGPFIYTGFRPAFVMIKNTQNGATSWVIADSKRNTFNEVDLWLQPNTSGAESDLGTTYDIDFLSNGFKIRESANFLNQSTYTLIYMAFAESPTKFSLGR